MSKTSVAATGKNIKRAVSIIDHQRGGGGTELLPALKRALFLPRAKGCSRSIVIVTDGCVSVEEEVFDLIRSNLGDVNMFTFGIGSSVNRHLVEGMARIGMGEPFVVTKPEEATSMAKEFRKLVESPVLIGIKIDFDGFKTYDIEPPGIPDALADRPIIVFGKWRGKAEGKIHLKGTTGDRPFIDHINVAEMKPMRTNSALRYLWARHRIGLLSDYNSLRLRDDRIQQVIELGLAYSLLTPYTSFVAIDTKIRREDGQVVTIKQPLPLPHGVSDYAVGENSSLASMACLSGSSSQVRMNNARSQIMERLPHFNGDTSDQGGFKSEEASNDSHIEIGGVVVPEGVSKKSVRELIKKQLSSINKCYKHATKNEVLSKRKIMLKLVADQKGQVTRVDWVTGGDEHGTFEQCVAESLKKLRFPVSKKAQTIEVAITLLCC
jgi:Ca-activated chloride channel family protein